MKITLAAALVQFALASAAAPVARRSALPFKQLVLFGDKLSAERGGRELSWPQMVSDGLGLPLVDYSVSGATTDNELVEALTPDGHLIPSTLDQVQEYISMNRESHWPEASLFVLSTGSNDFLLDSSVEASEVANRVESAARALAVIGARSFVIVAPTASAQDEAVEQLVSYSSDHLAESPSDYYAFFLRRSLRAITDRLARSMRSHRLDVVFVDLYRLYETIMENPVAFGFEDADEETLKTSCLQAAKELQVQVGGRQSALSLRPSCVDAAQRLYWSVNQPTDIGHELISKEVSHRIEAGFLPWQVKK